MGGQTTDDIIFTTLSRRASYTPQYSRSLKIKSPMRNLKFLNTFDKQIFEQGGDKTNETI